MAREPFELHIGVESPEHWDEREALERMSEVGDLGHGGRRRGERPTLADPAFPWEELGVVPRFVGSESVGCVAALQPNVYQGHGAEELRRFLDGTAARGETPLLVSMAGWNDEELINPVAPADANVLLPGLRGSIAMRRLPEGVRPELAEGLQPAEKDLGLRLRNRPEGSPWWSFKLSPTELVAGDGSGRTVREVGGVLEPILVNTIGEKIAGVWVPQDENWRWYVVPHMEWRPLIDWLVTRAIPQHVPAALRRAKAAELVDDALLTGRELAARDARARFEETVAVERERLDAEIAGARDAADEVRFGLLYGRGRPLVLAVKRVLEGAGFAVEDLDDTMSAAVSGDLLVSIEGRHWMVEVKSAGGGAGEDLIDDLQRHLRTWTELGRPEELSGGVLVVNHQLNRPPLERQREPYTRPPFVQSLPVAVITALALFGWWRDGDKAAIVQAVTGAPRQYGADLQTRGELSRLLTATSGRAHESSSVPGQEDTGRSKGKGSKRPSWLERLNRP